MNHDIVSIHAVGDKVTRKEGQIGNGEGEIIRVLGHGAFVVRWGKGPLAPVVTEVERDLEFVIIAPDPAVALPPNDFQWTESLSSHPEYSRQNLKGGIDAILELLEESRGDLHLASSHRATSTQLTTS